MDMDQHNFDKWAHQAFAALPKNSVIVMVQFKKSKQAFYNCLKSQTQKLELHKLQS